MYFSNCIFFILDCRGLPINLRQRYFLFANKMSFLCLTSKQQQKNDLQTIFFSLWLPLGLAAAFLASCKEQTVTPVDEPVLRVKAAHTKFGFWWPKRLLTKVDAGFKTCLDDQICKSNGGGTTAELCTFQCHERFKTTTRKSDPFFLGNQIITPPNLHVNSYYCTVSNSEGCIINVNAR